MAGPMDVPSEAAKKAQADYNRLRLATCVEETVLGQVADKLEGPPAEAHFFNPKSAVFADIPKTSDPAHTSSVQIGIVGKQSTVSVTGHVTPEGRLERGFSPTIRDPNIRDSNSALAEKQALEALTKVEACMATSAKSTPLKKPSPLAPKQ